MKYCFIINPKAGKRKALDVIPKIEAAIPAESREICVSKNSDEAIERVLTSDADCVVAVGGDGTLVHLLEPAQKTNKSIAVIPCGSGNDFVRSLADSYTVDSIISALAKEPKTRLSDFGTINGVCFTNVASVGIDALIALRAAELKKFKFIPPALNYYIAAVYTALTCKPFAAEVDVDGVKVKDRFLFVAAANGRFYGGGMKIAPNADISDGLFDTLLVKNVPKHKIIFFLLKFIKGKHINLPVVQFFRSKRVKITTSETVYANADGDIFPAGHISTISVNDTQLSVIDPSV